MNGAEALARTLVGAKVTACFANPGTSEMHFVSALDRVPGMRCVLGLAETVVTGCADGYGRMTGHPAATLLHCGPGLANGLANLHNAKRAYTPVVNIVGDHATYHVGHDTPLTCDVAALAHPVSRWVRLSRHAREVADDAALAVQAACGAPGGVATLILPADTAWSPSAGPRPALPVPDRPQVESPRIDEAARALRQGQPAMILLGTSALSQAGLSAAWRLAGATGAALRTTTFVARMPRGQGRPPIDRLPYAVDQAVAELAPMRTLILAGAPAPAAFFAYPDKPSELWAPGTHVLSLAGTGEDAETALIALADALAAPVRPLGPPPAPGPGLPHGPFTPAAFGQVLAGLLPAGSIVMEDAVTSGRGLFGPTFGAAPHDWLQNTGGAIGGGMPTATGAAIACPDRPVVCLQADGAGMYSLQALWTQARESLKVVTIVFSNRAYRILQAELHAVGATPGPASEALFKLTEPSLDWVSLAQGMGVPARRVDTMQDLADALGRALRSQGPFLIELLC
ncbi:acetolactate synthase large subunit [Orrella sp. JC864]|uniref:acetolactate synthase large subunit n=1 Tax=Orrella sp. JC864 TaxID=3120298 RepID=UPI003009BACE